MKNRFIIVTHLLFVVLAYTSWIWLDWRILAVLAVGHLIMLESMKGCPLSHVQFPDDKDKRFYEWWMGKLGVKLNKASRRRVRIFMQYLLPLILIAFGFILQVLIGIMPLVGF